MEIETKIMLKKSLLYFFPVMVIQIVFFALDKSVQVNLNMSEEYIELRSTIICLEVFFCLFIIPLYLMIVNVILNLKNEIDKYYDDIKLIFLSVFISNICILILNIGSRYIYNVIDINYILEFIMIFVPEIIATGVLCFIGAIILEKSPDEEINDESDEEEIIDKQITEELNNNKELNMNNELTTASIKNDSDNFEKETDASVEFIIESDK